MFSLVDSSFNKEFENVLVFYGIEETRSEYLEKAEALGLKHYSIIKSPKKYLKSFKSFKRILNAERPDRIIVHSSELIIPAVKYVKRSSNSKVIYAEHEPNHTKTALEHYLSKYAMKKADHVVVLNSEYKEELSNKYHKLDKISLIPNGIDTDFFSPKPSHSTDLFLIGMAARITDTKDHLLLIKSVQKLKELYPNLQLSIAGIGDQMSGIEKYVQQANLENHVIFKGLLNETELKQFYQSLDLYVHATKSETLSTSILQALSCELPVITSDIKNNKALITNDQNGWLYEDQQLSSLISKIKFAIENEDERKKIAKEGRVFILENFTAQSMQEHYRKLLS